MKRFLSMISSVFLLSLALSGLSPAAETRDEQKLQQEAAAIDATAGKAEGEKAVTRRLEKEFNVTEDQVKGLRDKQLGFGEISIALSLSQKLPGGVTEDNITKILTLRQGPPSLGWGEVAKQLGTKLGRTVSQVRHVNRESNKELRHGARGEKEHELEKKHGEKHQEQYKEMRGHDDGNGRESSRGKGR